MSTTQLEITKSNPFKLNSSFLPPEETIEPLLNPSVISWLEEVNKSEVKGQINRVQIQVLLFSGELICNPSFDINFDSVNSNVLVKYHYTGKEFVTTGELHMLRIEGYFDMKPSVGVNEVRVEFEYDSNGPGPTRNDRGTISIAKKS